MSDHSHTSLQQLNRFSNVEVESEARTLGQMVLGRPENSTITAFFAYNSNRGGRPVFYVD